MCQINFIFGTILAQLANFNRIYLLIISIYLYDLTTIHDPLSLLQIKIRGCSIKLKPLNVKKEYDLTRPAKFC